MKIICNAAPADGDSHDSCAESVASGGSGDASSETDNVARTAGRALSRSSHAWTRGDAVSFSRVQLAAAAASGRRSPRSSASGQRRRRRQRCQRIKTTTVPARIESEHTSATHQPRVVGELKAIDVYFEGLVTRSMTAN